MEDRGCCPFAQVCVQRLLMNGLMHAQQPTDIPKTPHLSAISHWSSCCCTQVDGRVHCLRKPPIFSSDDSCEIVGSDHGLQGIPVQLRGGGFDSAPDGYVAQICILDEANNGNQV